MIALYFDTETNGIKTWDNPAFKLRLVQLGAILQDTETRRVLAEINLIADQKGEHIPEGASDVHGISDELAKQFGFSPLGIDRLFRAMIEKANVLVAHNIAYDFHVVQDSMPESWVAIRT